MVRATTETELLDEICGALTGGAGYRLAWIGYVESSNRNVIRSVAHAGDEEGLRLATDSTWENVETGRGPAATAIRTSRPSVIHPLQTANARAPGGDLLSQRGCGSAIGLPLRWEESTLGAVAIYATENGAFEPAETDFLAELSNDLAFGIVAIRTRDERRSATEALGREQALLGSLLGAIPDHIYFKDRQSRFIRINNAQAEHFGLSDPGAAIGKTDFDFFSEEHARQAFDDERRVMDTGEPLVGVEEKETWADGHVTWVSTTKVPVRDPDGRVIGLMGISRDVTARKRFEIALIESEARYRLLFEQSPVSKWVYDLETLRFLDVNAAAQERYGYSREEFLRMTIRDIRPAEDLRDLEADVAQAKGRSAKSGEWRHRKKDGALIHVLVHAHDIEVSGRRARMVVVQDITERRSLEEQLRQSQKMEAIGQLAGGVAHDFNNILTVIKGYSQLLLRDSALPSEIRESMLQISTAANRAARLTGQLLAFGRKQAMELEILDLAKVVAEMAEMLRRVIGEHITLFVNQAADLPPIRGDAGMIEQIILNLAVNARDAMPDGGRLTVSTNREKLEEAHLGDHPEARPGEYVCLRIRDTGLGMTPDVMARIFEPFFTTKGLGKGTGLGLATVHGIVHQHHGWIEVVSSVGVGSTFAVYLPVAAGTPGRPTSKPRRPSLAPITAATILLVEDEEPVRDLAQIILERAGYRVFASGSAAAALEEWKQHKSSIDLVITDLVLPDGLRGSALVTQLKSERPALRAVYMSGYASGDAGDGVSLKVGVNFLPKPFALEALTTIVHDSLSASGG